MTEPQSTASLHPLISRLVNEYNYPLLEESSLAAFLAQAGDVVLFCAGDPIQYPECLDVAVILPELEKAVPGQFRYAVCSRDTDPVMQARYGFNRWPTLVFLRDGAYVGIISGVQDWTAYLERIGELLKTPAGRPPAIGIAVNASSAASCH